MTGGRGRRFIAGAVCPSCAEMDRIVVEIPDPAGEPRRRCVACGFTDAAGAGAAHVPATRHDRKRATASDVAPTPVRLLKPERKP